MMEFPIDPELRQELSGDEAAMKLQALFQEHHARLQRLVRIRLDSRLRGRVRSATVLDRAFLRMRHELAAYVQFPELSPYVWMRKVTGDALSEVHRDALPDTGDSQSQFALYRGAFPQVSPKLLAGQVLGQMASGAEEAARARMQLRTQEFLNQLDPLDREVLVLRHLEELNTSETAEVLELDGAEVSRRFMDALKNLTRFMKSLPEQN
ncbi:MAG: hypothetical protein CMJ69_07985 [Planctomycetaceae bacterium]|nr:hypothetical protein [Planctomycetaceae bacterium]